MISDLLKLNRLIDREKGVNRLVRWSQIGAVESQDGVLPLFSYSVGSQEPRAPVLFMTGGVHGLERIGAQLCWSLLKTTMDRLLWDRALQELFRHVRLVAIPLVNPYGYVHMTRSNGRGVDLMRNSPVNAVDETPYLVGGHRISPQLPWYRGEPGVLEVETAAVLDRFRDEAGASQCVISLDFHSGYGMRDRVWFPFSYARTPFDDLPQLHALTHFFEQAHPYHIYRFEPQARAYLLSGDLWDHAYLEFKKDNPACYLPLTLEMGSWSWVRKNPLQIFSRHGAFNPIKQHRLKRTYRRHHLLYEFLLRALRSHDVWSCLEPSLRRRHERLGLERWYA